MKSSLLVALMLVGGVGSARAEGVEGYRSGIPPESPAARAARHQAVAARRAGSGIIVHRGASAFAPENTLEAYAAAMDYGADGCEVDVRRTADGVLVLFHDDMLDHLTDGFGTVEQLTYPALLALRPRFVYGTATATTRAPTFAALLALARQRAMLLHLDVKDPGLDADLARQLEAADVWDHVVAVNETTAPTLAKDARVRTLPYKGPGLQEERRDMDRELVRAQLARPGQLVMVDDPRLAARELGRPPYQPVPLPEGLRQRWEPGPAAPPGEAFVPESYLRGLAARVDPRSPAALLTLLETSPPERTPPAGGEGEQRAYTEAIVARAWAAQRLGELGEGSPRAARLLESLVRQRSLHRDWMYHGLDGAMAARALGQLGVTAAAPLLVEAFRRVDPALKEVVDPRFAQNPLAWTDFRLKMALIPALGELRCPASKAFLQEYVAMDAAKARELAPIVFDEATRSLLRQELNQEELAALLRSPHPAVRGSALLGCLDEPTAARAAALKEVVPWAAELPRRPKARAAFPPPARPGSR